ncbi:5-carboxymethyl-2-hydroxymuconate Delta-isomerase [Actinomadura macrotermitis]|uniref:Isomerase n=1 Tax=Actinomadura macrotermitis TaxID=2585200 RepID=A0A7K0BVJ9_9ACTN|nr:isomerase [Actinomadura macrotermitis]MQY05201.1 hypothetical protein [Actinomadura macrotermitis]
MPQITVEYSAPLAEAFDRRPFALALHARSAELIGSALDAHKTRFVPLDQVVIGDGDPAHAMIHVDLAIMAGRDAATRDRLAGDVLDLVRAHLKDGTGYTVQTTVEIRELAPELYFKHVVA